MQNPKKRNWSHYNHQLKRQASLDLYISSEIFHAYAGPRRPGGIQLYQSALIEACLLVRCYFSLALRQTQGFLESWVRRLGINGTVPDYTTLCRRAKTLTLSLNPKLAACGKGYVIAIDSTGLSCLSSDSWNRYKHRKQRGNYSWHKLHIVVDTESGEILACDDSSATVNDCEMLPHLLGALPADMPIEAVCGDMAYDTIDCRKAIMDLKARQLIPPKANAVHSTKRANPLSKLKRAIVEERDNAIGYMQANTINGSDEIARKQWKKLVGYHRRSLAETAMSRIKTHTGNTLKSRIPATRATECRIKCKALNLINNA